MDTTANCPLAPQLAARLRGARDAVTARWLERIADRVAIDANRVFPTDDLLDHVPLLIDGIANYVEDPADTVVAHAAVLAKGMELGALRHAQGFAESEVLKEFELLGAVVYTFLARVVDDLDGPCTQGELMICAQRVFHAIVLIQQAAAGEFLRRTNARLAEREERLRAFNRTVTHELRNRLNAALGASELIEELPEMPDAQRRRIVAILSRNMSGMRAVLDDLLELSQLTSDTRQQRNVRLPRAVAEAARELRDAAEARGVTVSISPTLPDVDVNAAAVELILGNLLSNAIKYADPATRERWVDVRGRIDASDAEHGPVVVIAVADNGVGVPANERAHLFERFFRATKTVVTGAEGSGLGLSIVRDIAEQLGGRAWAEFPDAGGAMFCIALPCRRASDAEAVAHARRTASA